MKILAIDPGSTESGWAYYCHDTKTPLDCGVVPNNELWPKILLGQDRLVIELVRSFGNIVGDSMFQTCIWSGRFAQYWIDNGRPRESVVWIPRKEVMMALCGISKGGDGHIRQAIMDRYGSTRQLAIGTKKAPGPLHRVKYDAWSALALAIVGAETEPQKWQTTIYSMPLL